MKRTIELLQMGQTREIWTRHCGFINLSREQFMEIQIRLWQEQMDLFYGSQLGKKFLNGKKPQNIDDFRAQVPYTTYEDYTQYLDQKNEEVLPRKPYMWARTSGRTSTKGPKWVPYTKQMYDLLGDATIGAMIMSSCSERGEVNLQLGDTLLLSTAPPPYVSGLLSYSTRDQLEVKFLPSLEEGEKMDFIGRVAAGFDIAMREGLDYFYGVASILTRMGERFEQQSGGSTRPSARMLNPLVLWRLLRAVIKTKIQNRSLLPKDIWKLKGIMTGGTDTAIYKDKIEYYWGRKPLEGYASTESGVVAVQGWNYKGLVFYPDRVFLEFIPYDEQVKSKSDPDYQPKSVLFDELEEGIYEMVFTSFHGGAFVRYRGGDMFEVISIGDEGLGSELPQVRFYSRTQDVIDLGGMVRLTEKDIWRAVESSGLRYQEWLARREFTNEVSNLHLYIELKPGESAPIEIISRNISKNLRDQLEEFKDYEKIIDRNPLIISLLPEGTFDAYMDAQQKAGADMAHIKPPHMQPSDDIMERLLPT